MGKLQAAAIEIIEQYGKAKRICGFIEILEVMTCDNGLDADERTALEILMRAGQAMFAPVMAVAA